MVSEWRAALWPVKAVITKCTNFSEKDTFSQLCTQAAEGGRLSSKWAMNSALTLSNQLKERPCAKKWARERGS